jgi:hypothetical protein
MNGEPAKEETRQLRHATFECAACNTGTENFLTLFPDGTCSHCGNPAGVVVETSRPEDIEKIRKSVMVVSSEEDSGKAKQMMEEMTDEGISVIDPTLVSENERAGNRANVLTFLANDCKLVLVVPSKDNTISGDRLVSASVEQAFDSPKSKVVPLYPDGSYIGRSPLLDSRMGVMWEGRGGKTWGKNRFIDYMKGEPSEE